MKSILRILSVICLVVSAAGQTADPDPTANDPTVAALRALLPLKQQASFGKELRANHKRTKFAGFLGTQGRFALLANKEALISVRAEAERPNYGGNAAARTHKNLWRAILDGKITPASTQPANTGD